MENTGKRTVKAALLFLLATWLVSCQATYPTFSEYIKKYNKNYTADEYSIRQVIF
jgi:thiol-disulfide isomerase/thioredoxin